jgi:hypothetical protein
MNNILFQDNLRTADKIEAARKAREEQINKGLFYGSTPSMESEIEKAVQSQPLDANGGGTDVLYPEVETYKQQLDNGNVTETWIDLQMQNIQKRLIYDPTDERLLQMKQVLLDKRKELRNKGKATGQALSASRKAKSLLLSPEDIVNGSRARDKAVQAIIRALKEEFGNIEADLKDGVHRGGKMQTYTNATLTFGRESMTTPLVVNIPSGFSNRDIQNIKTRATEMAKAYGMQMLYGERTTDIILWINPTVYYDVYGMWHDYTREQSLKSL